MVAEVTQDEHEGRAEQLRLPLPGLEMMVTHEVTQLLEELDLIPDALFAKTIGVTQQTLAGWRCSGQGPEFVKLGRGVFYRREDVRKWIASSVASPEK